jgi:hypothetical protein
MYGGGIMIAKWKRNAEYLVLYDNQYYTDCSHPTIYELNEIDQLCKRIGVKYRTLIQYLSRGFHLPNGMELYKQTDKELEKLI